MGALDRNVYDLVRQNKMTLSQYLEQEMPAPEGSKLDAYQYQLKDAGIYTKAVPEKGIYASEVEKFFTTEHSRVLFPEYIARQIREAISEDTMLPYLIGIQTPLEGDTYRSFYVDDQPGSQRKKRVTESAELPRAKITKREQAVRLYKYGRAIEASYEFIRRVQIDMLALHVQRIAIEASKDKVSEIITTIEDGDGNDNAADVLEQRDLDSGATDDGQITAKGFIRFLMEYEEFPCDTIIADKDSFIQLVLTNVPSLSTTDLVKLLATGTTVGVNLNAPQMPTGTIRLFWHDDVGANKVMGISRANAIEEIKEVGSDINEADKFITRQTSVLTISENIGYSKLFKEATKILDFETGAS